MVLSWSVRKLVRVKQLFQCGLAHGRAASSHSWCLQRAPEKLGKSEGPFTPGEKNSALEKEKRTASNMS